MALKNFTQFTPYTVLSSTDNFVGYRVLDEIRTDFSSLTDAISGLLIIKGFTPGSSVGVVRKVSYRYTITSGSSLNAVSGADDYGLVLSYQPSQVEVYRNGAHLAESLDFVATTGNQITNLSALNTGDIVEVVALSSSIISQVGTISGSGDAIGSSFRYTVATGNTIEPGDTLIAGVDDFGSLLSFTLPNFEVYLNGSHLVRDQDYGSYNSGTALTLNESVANGDTVDVVTLSAYNLTSIVGISAYNGIQRIQAGKDFYISNITGTGVVTLSAKPGIRDIKVPDWTTGAHITNWSTLQLYLSSVASSNRFTQASANYVQQFGSFTGGAAFVGGVVSPNGYVYLVPSFVSKYYKINPNDNTVTSFGTTPWNGSQLGAFHGGVLAPNGKIYFIPASTSMCYGVDPSSDTVFSFGSFTGNAIANNTSLYAEGVLAPNGKIYCFPFRSSLCQVIDPSNNSVASFGTFVQSGNGVGGVLAPNGRIYMSIDTSNVAKFIDPSNNTVTAFATLSFNPGGPGVLAINNKIYFASSTSFGAIIDPSNNTVTSFGTFGFSGALTAYAFRGVLLPNGFIYLFAHTSTLAHIIDPSNNSVTSFAVPHGGTGTASYHGGVQALNGKLIYVPHAATSSLAVNFLNNNIFNSNVITNPLNKP